LGTFLLGDPHAIADSEEKNELRVNYEIIAFTDTSVIKGENGELLQANGTKEVVEEKSMKFKEDNNVKTKRSQEGYVVSRIIRRCKQEKFTVFMK
jgi:hypothetical protein